MSISPTLLTILARDNRLKTVEFNPAIVNTGMGID